ncbi:epoxyqueuosine reductase [Desulfobacterales bacterium HSG2]|nr:epoxyqueuosine reductase [Desulfobacterales bacterium HSG2]MDM8548551.1 epoxyqueuosine reductase [Desulfobacterales bacterium HSG2]
MNALSGSELAEKIVEKARSLGASVAGVADTDALKASPSHRIYPKIGMNLGVKPREVAWPADAVSAVVIGVEHGADEPELDWWDGREGTPGNRILMRISGGLSEWIENAFSIRTYKLPYHVEKGGIFLKDAAVMAGLGCIGRNNLVVTPEYGPRIRFRAILLDRETKAAGPVEFNPCEDCKQPCRKACPQDAFQNTVCSADEPGLSVLPGIRGTFDRVACNVRMQKDIDEGIMVKPEGDEEPYKCIRYCRLCELACPVGN